MKRITVVLGIVITLSAIVLFVAMEIPQINQRIAARHMTETQSSEYLSLTTTANAIHRATIGPTLTYEAIARKTQVKVRLNATGTQGAKFRIAKALEINKLKTLAMRVPL